MGRENQTQQLGNKAFTQTTELQKPHWSLFFSWRKFDKYLYYIFQFYNVSTVQEDMSPSFQPDHIFLMPRMI